ncbi:MFS transporter [Gottfriedia acidiceleris]|uniref:MFS transporter n=1 Tax=Gottfriedia acidiceleris TaxID=371036 RepID=A0ABY4JPA0_9BACI|nr:MFS transporter [Gottfriedia acidiceleris]UPM55665.1 MFS transporter [Gottfriedia acidiceleris]
MSKWKFLIGDVDLNKDLILLLSVGGLFTLATALSSTFVNVYLWKQSNNYLPIASYQFSIAFFQALTFVIAGRLAKTIDRVFILRAGISFLAIFYIVVLLFETKTLLATILIGAILGVGNGCYYLAFNLLTFEVTEPETRQFFNGFLGLINSFTGMLGPFIAGAIISSMIGNKGYHFVFLAAVILFICAVALSCFLVRRELDSEFNIKRVIQERKLNENWRKVTYANFFQGIREGIFVFVISIYIFLSTGSEFALGKYGLITSLISFITYYIVTRIIKENFRMKAIFIGGFLLFCAVFVIAFKVSFPLLIIYGAIISLAYPIILVPYLSLTYDIIGKSYKAREYRVEYIVIREVYLNSGRMLSIAVFIVCTSLFQPEQVIPLLMCLFGAGHLLVYFVMRKLEYKHA